MKNVDLKKAASVGLFFFTWMLVLTTWGPLANGKSVFPNMGGAFLGAVLFAVLLAWMGRLGKDDRGPVIELPEATAHRVDELLDDGKTVAAVKAVRDDTRAGLKLAVRTVEARAGERINAQSGEHSPRG